MEEEASRQRGPADPGSWGVGVGLFRGLPALQRCVSLAARYHDLPAAKIGNTATVDEAHAKEAAVEVALIKI
jgi:hypothetical protein